jgi:uncharacterized Zn finger protein
MEDLHYEYDDAPVNKAALRAKVEQKLNRRRAEGETLEPLLPTVKKELCTTFWGQAWNKNLMHYADYESRMAPARTALRRGDVLGLQLRQGLATATVMGLDLYEVQVRVKPLDSELWEEIKQDCAGQVGTLVELLSGQLSKAVMQRVTLPDCGLFPSPSEIKSSCSCPDDARLCTHAAAVLYGVGIRLDADPALLFSLRAVEPMELIPSSATLAVDALVSGAESDLEADTDLSEVFGIDLKG